MAVTVAVVIKSVTPRDVEVCIHGINEEAKRMDATGEWEPRSNKPTLSSHPRVLCLALFSTAAFTNRPIGKHREYASRLLLFRS